MTSKTKMPAAPNKDQITQQQKTMNDSTAADNRKFNNVNISGPTGSSTWTTNSDGTMSQNISLNSNQQTALDNQQGVAADLSGLARRMIGDVDTGAFGIPAGLPTRTTGLDASGMKNLNSTDYGAARDSFTNDMFAKTMALLQPDFDKQDRDAEQFLSNRGIPVVDQGDGAASGYRSSIKRGQDNQRLQAARNAVEMGAAEQSRLFGLDQSTNENILRNQTTDAGFRDNARDKGIEEAYQEYNAPLERIRQLFGSTPELEMMGAQDFNGFASQGGDVAGNAWNEYNAKMEQAKIKSQENNAMMNGLFGLAGTAGKIWAGGGI